MGVKRSSDRGRFKSPVKMSRRSMKHNLPLALLHGSVLIKMRETQISRPSCYGRSKTVSRHQLLRQCLSQPSAGQIQQLTLNQILTTFCAIIAIHHSIHTLTVFVQDILRISRKGFTTLWVRTAEECAMGNGNWFAIVPFVLRNFRREHD